MKSFTFLAVLSVFLALPVEVSACDSCARVGILSRLGSLRPARTVSIAKSVTINRVERPRRARVFVLDAPCQHPQPSAQIQSAPGGGSASASAAPGAASSSASSK